MVPENRHIKAVYAELEWLERVIHQVITSYLKQEGHELNWYDIDLPIVTESRLHDFQQKHKLDIVERIALALGLAPYVRPELLDIFFGKNQIYDRPFSEFGGVTDTEFSGFIPTLQTLAFLTTSTNVDFYPLFLAAVSTESALIKEQVLQLESTKEHLPESANVIQMNKRWVHYFITGEDLPLEQSHHFPAQRISTKLDWEDVVLEDFVFEQVNEISAWLNHSAELMDEWGLDRKIKPGFRALFYGPPGTGKTLTATLLGKATNRDVYRVDLSMVVSKYIGETEKNLARIFDIAEHKDWILFFDEADSLFGKRTAANSSNDRHANQQTGYLLQRIEDFPGVVILATNLKDNMDQAFSRRFQAMIHFNMPGPEQRYQLWLNAFSGKCRLADDIDVYQLAERYELAGGAIINVLRNCALAVVQRNETVVQKQDLVKALRKEFKKEHKTLTQEF